MAYWAGDPLALPPGWLLADGSETPAGYPELSQLLGGAFGGVGPNGRSLLPDCRGRFIIASAPARPRGAVGGAESATLAPANLPSHTHSLSGTRLKQYTALGPIGSDPFPYVRHDGAGDPLTDQLTATGEAAPAPFSILPPYVALGVMIRG